MPSPIDHTAQLIVQLLRPFVQRSFGTEVGNACGEIISAVDSLVKFFSTYDVLAPTQEQTSVLTLLESIHASLQKIVSVKLSRFKQKSAAKAATTLNQSVNAVCMKVFSWKKEEKEKLKVSASGSLPPPPKRSAEEERLLKFGPITFLTPQA